jgi:hypothetical protein
MIRAIPKSQPAPRNVETLVLYARCPSCGRAPNLRITRAERDESAGRDPEIVRATYGCHGRGCKAVYVITYLSYQKAYQATDRRAA